MEAPVANLMLFEKIMVAALENGEIRVFGVISGEEVSRLYCSFDVIGLVHPATYVNKILVVGKKELELWNIWSGNKIFGFQEKEPLGRILEGGDGAEISCLEMSPAVDFAAIGFTSGDIVIMNLKKNKVLQVFKQGLGVTSLGFSKNFKFKPV